MPSSDEDDWDLTPRTRILVRREGLLEDALSEVRKNRFDPTKLLDVSEAREQRNLDHLCDVPLLLSRKDI